MEIRWENFRDEYRDGVRRHVANMDEEEIEWWVRYFHRSYAPDRRFDPRYKYGVRKDG